MEGERKRYMFCDVKPEPSKGIRLQRPKDRKCIDHMAYFLLHEDGVQCFNQSGIGDSFLCVTLELLNCNQVDRVSKGMTLFACIIQNRNDKDSVKEMREFLDEYIHLSVISGMKGIYLHYDGAYHHWRWTIYNICSDSVAAEEIVGQPNKKNSKEPCVEWNCCRVKYSLAEQNTIPFESPTVVTDMSNLTLLGQSLGCFHPQSGYRLASVAAHSPDWRKTLEEMGLPLEEPLIGEVSSLSSLFSLFKPSVIQWMPVLNNISKMQELRQQELSLHFEGDADVLNYIKPKETPKKEDSIHPEERLLVPKGLRFVQDQMHFVSNVCGAFLDYLRGKWKKDKQEASFLNNYVGRSVFGTDGANVNLFGVDSWIIEKARSRMHKLKCPTSMNWLNTILDGNCFEKAKTYDCSIFTFCFFAYAFQDAMKHMTLLCMKVILDCLSYMYNFDSDYSELMNCQSVLNLFSGLLQGQTNPSSTTPSPHRTCHTGLNCLCIGCFSCINCYHQEHEYGIIRVNVMNSPNVNKTVQKRVLANSVTSLYIASIESDNSKQTVDTEVEGTILEFIQTHLDTVVFCIMTMWNTNDDSFFYHCDWLPVNTMLDRVVLLLDENASTSNISSFLVKTDLTTMKKWHHVKNLFADTILAIKNK